jgi:alpha-tubulin suppressor-like RCC1 family protein
LFAWGNGAVTGLGFGSSSVSSPVLVGNNPLTTSSPTQVGASSWTAVSAGSNHTAAIRSDGLLFAWGLATSGQLGDGSIVNKSSPVQIGSSSWIQISAGRYHTIGR